MRHTGTVTGQAYAIPPGTTLVSVTDLQGRITFCNRAFVRVSGYGVQELLGQPHNLVRHPDMPAEAFRDLWATLKSGRPWTGLVKNRRKDGDHYWVLANVTPMVDGERITGFLSVRMPAPAGAVPAAEALYARMRAEAQRGRIVTALQHGRVVRQDLLGRWRRRLAPTPARRAWMLPLASSALAMAAVQVLGAHWGVPLGVAAALGCAWQLRRDTFAPLTALVRDAQRLGAGDLVHQVRTGDDGPVGEMQAALQQLAVNLRSVVLDARHDIEALSGVVQEIHAGNQALSGRTERQAADLQQTASSMDEITATVAQSADSAHRAAGLAGLTSEVARRSHEAVQAVSACMDEIRASSGRIGDIIQVVESVAFQTNILPLNAAVEAARAGEHGRGFAVVASEVRSLAGRTAAAAREIKALVEESAARVHAGEAQTRVARERMDEAVQSVGRVATMVDEITRAVGEQRSGIALVNDAVSSLDGVTQQNAAMVEELAATAQTLLQQVDAIGTSTRVFRLARGERTVAEMDAVELRRSFKAVESAQAQDIDFTQAVQAHAQWKARLRSAADQAEPLDAATVRRDDACALGRWIHGAGKLRCAHHAAFGALRDHHAAFHREAATVADAVNRGDTAAARAMLEGNTAFSRSTSAVILSIRTLASEMEAEAPA